MHELAIRLTRGTPLDTSTRQITGTDQKRLASKIVKESARKAGIRAMVTNYPQQLTAVRPVATGDLVSRTMTRLGQVICGMRGHESVVHFEGKRVMMRCTSCGHDTPGWDTGERAPRRRYDGDARRHLLVTTPPKLVLRRTA